MTIFSSKYPDLEPRNQSITQRVFEGLVDRPNEIVLTDGITGNTLTASELIASIKSFAGGLTKRGLGKGHVIALMAPNSPEFCTIFHGAAWAGAITTTINPTYTENEIRHQLKDAGAEILITIPALLEVTKAAIIDTSVSEIFVIGTADGTTPLSDLMGNPQVKQTPIDPHFDVVVLPYSSGTTGLPKGVMLTHENLVRNVDQVLAYGIIEAGDETPAFLPCFHIYGLLVFMNAYLAGQASVVTMPRFDLEVFLQLTERHKSRALWVVPPVAIALAKHPMIDQFDLSSLETVFCAAAPLSADLSRIVSERLNCSAVQGYGMTELSPVSHAIPKSAPRAGSVGLTAPQTSCQIVDSQTGERLGANQEGELWVKGPQVMKGYLNNAKATAETLDEDGWLHTGDIGYFDEDGYLFIVDRLKELIKYKGFQVAPAELEATLLAHEKIADAAVIGIPDEEAGEVPMAFVVLAPEQTLSEDEIKQHIAKNLAAYKQIRRIEFTDAIPKSASGKILRRLLRDQLNE
ncbi:MAG: 4-coumarate--CoA ligase family protein [Paracoccaceae bacterium]